MRMNLWLTGIGLFLALGSGTAAQQPKAVDHIPPMPSMRFVGPYRPTTIGNEATKIIGTVIDIRQVPVADVRVRLRNLVTGAVLQETTTDANGEYAFEVEEPGTYVVEMVLVDGVVVALSNAGSIARFETVQTVVQLPGRWNVASRTMAIPQNVSAFAGVSSATSITATTLTIAVEQNVAPTDSGQPVSPVTP
jgi:hypothetical protein